MITCARGHVPLGFTCPFFSFFPKGAVNSPSENFSLCAQSSTHTLHDSPEALCQIRL